MTLGTRPRQRLTLTVACTAQVMMVLDVMIVSVALPSLQRELHLSPAGLEWVVSAYALALAALIPTGGALGDHFGRKRVFMSGVALFMLECFEAGGGRGTQLGKARRGSGPRSAFEKASSIHKFLAPRPATGELPQAFPGTRPHEPNPRA